MDELTTHIRQRMTEIESARAQLVNALNAEAAQRVAPYDAALGELRQILGKLAEPASPAPGNDPPAPAGAAGARPLLDGATPLRLASR